MQDSALAFALLSGGSVAAYTVFQRLGSGGISPALGAMVVAGVALLVNVGVMLGMKMRGHAIVFTPRGFLFVAAAGLAAGGIDLFGLLAFARGLKVSSSLVITGTQTALVLLVGVVFLHEPFSWPKLLAIGLIATGTLLLHVHGV